MRSALPYPRLYLFAAMAPVAGVLAGMAGWPQPERARAGEQTPVAHAEDLETPPVGLPL